MEVGKSMDVNKIMDVDKIMDVNKNMDVGQVKEVAEIPAVVLAAGYSSRMEAFKPLLPLGEGLVLDYVAVSLRQAGIKDIYLVTGYAREKLRPAIEKHDLIEVYNSSFSRGMFSSIQAGIKALPRQAPGCFLVPVDCPLFGSETLEKMVEGITAGTTVEVMAGAVGEPGEDTDRGAEQKTEKGTVFAVPVYRGKKGHPLYVPKRHFAEIVNHDGGGGLKAVTDKYFEEMLRISVPGEGVLMDMDTQEQYENVKFFLAGGKVSEKLAPLAPGRRFILVRHGQIRQHKEKIFLGQTDVPLSQVGIDQAREAGTVVGSLEPETDRIYASNLARAWETGEAIAVTLGTDPEIVPVPGFREMSLGDWDGRFISEIRREEPDAYRLRGKYIWSYKKGNRSENFYDLQYRVVKALIQLLKEDPRRDIIIVAHKGVLRAIENNLKGGCVSDDWKAMDNGEVRVVEL